jgi:hypothetical protein
MKINLPDPRTREGVKTISRFVVARLTSICVVTVISQNTDPETPMQTAGVLVGSHVIGEMVADATKPFVDRQIDELADALAEAKQTADTIKVDATRE